LHRAGWTGEVVCEPDLIVLPKGFSCLATEYSLYHDPPCRCAGLWIDPISASACYGLGASPKQFKEFEEVLRPLKFLSVLNQATTGRCGLVPSELEAVAQWKDLRYIQFETLVVDQMPASWGSLTQLRALVLRYTTIQDLSYALTKSWTRLEHLEMTWSPRLEAVPASLAKLPRLREVVILGKNDSKAESLGVCPGFPDWLLQHYALGLKRAGEYAGCGNPACGAEVQARWDRYDMDDDHSFSAAELGTSLIPAYRALFDVHDQEAIPKEAMACFLSALGLDPTGGLPRHVFFQVGGYTSCGECGFPEVAATGEDRDWPAECADRGKSPVETLADAACSTEGTCVSICQGGVVLLSSFDMDTDGWITPAEITVAAQSATASVGDLFFPGFPACIKAISPCPTGDRDGFSAGRVVAMALAAYGFPPSDCSEC